ncbi:Peptidase A2 domain-containing protein [Pleurotus pulmonarius]
MAPKLRATSLDVPAWRDDSSTKSSTGTITPSLSSASKWVPQALTQTSDEPRHSDDLEKASIRSSTSSHTYAPSVTLSRSDSHVRKYKYSSTTALDDAFVTNDDVPTRLELNAALGADIIPLTTEITSLPCAGIRIAHGRLTGLMAWRFAVQLPNKPTTASAHPAFIPHKPAIITNFILDTGSLRSLVPPETLYALGFSGKVFPGAEVRLLVQGVPVTCKVAPNGHAGRLSAQFMVAASLALYFDERLMAPVLYYVAHDNHAPSPGHIPTTVPSPPSPPFTLKQLIMSLVHLGHRPN